jgi:predicted nucleic acid-binding protein
MVICADTSFLFSLYGNDTKTAEAVAWSVTNTSAIWISSFNHFELLNALRFAECRRFIDPGQADQFIAEFLEDLSSANLIEKTCNLGEILTEANRLSRSHTLNGGHRGFDILHVAAAKILHASHFLTFDTNQRKLAENEGLVVPL